MREHKRVLYYTLLTSGKLYEHLAEIDTSARDMAEYLTGLGTGLGTVAVIGGGYFLIRRGRHA